ncbi:spondin domain-containing protein [Pseudoduganella lutea]|nr:spondin domain-containing protein [Pseudoduganella lutea]
MNKFSAFAETVAPAPSTNILPGHAARRPALRAAIVLGCALAASGAATTVHADEAESDRFAASRPSSVTVSVTNLTHATWFAPILVAAHHAGFTGFSEGKPASPALQALAEIGDIAPLAETLPAGSAAVLNPAGGPLKPGGTTTVALPNRKGASNTHLSILAMLVPTNDGFTALNSIAIPTMPGKYVYTLGAYDAGTEANDEARASAAGVGQPGMGLPPFLNDADGNLAPDIYPDAPGFAHARPEGYVHGHRGIVGGPAGGDSALDHVSYRWMNPVARVTLTVK